MAKEPKRRDAPALQTLRDAFRAVEAQPVPADLTDHVEKLTAPKRRPDSRS